MRHVSISRLLDIGIALSKEKDGERLQEFILNTAMEVTGCDGGTLYILSEGYLDFKLMVTKSLNVLKGGRYGAIDLPPVPLGLENACTRAALERSVLNIYNGSSGDGHSFTGTRKYDEIIGYRTISMLVVPMEDDKGRIIGVLQLINALNEDGEVIPFDEEYGQVVQSLASQAAISLTNMNYASAVQGMVDSFARVMSTAIDARIPYNANHTRGMVRLGSRFIDWLNAQKGRWSFDNDRKRLFLLSVWLHDIGKLAVPLEVINKETRLAGQLEAVLYRFRIISLLSRVAVLDGRITKAEYEKCKQQLKEADELIHRTNRIYFLEQEDMDRIAKLRSRVYEDEQGHLQPWLTDREAEALSIPRGTLSNEERAIIESHVVMTARMLAEMNFPIEFTCVPLWAGMHHEFLNGTGYPKHLSGDQVPREARLLTILDIFDAITQDRPYSSPQPPEQALRTLESMAEKGLLDGEILVLFKESRVWERETER